MNENNLYGNYNQENMNQPDINNNYSSNTCKLTLKRAKSFVASLVAFKIFIDGELVGKIKNGETITFDVTRGQHEIAINNNNQTTVMINNDTTVDVVIFGANNFGITNINGENGSMQNNIDLTPKYETQALGVLIASVVLPIISVILYFVTDHKYVLQFWFYSIIIGYGIINIHGLKNIKGTDKYKSLLMKNVIAMVIALISLIVTLYITTIA